jgi:hypothetical protein
MSEQHTEHIPRHNPSVTTHGLCASTHHGAKLPKPQSFAYANMTHLSQVTKLEREVQRGSEISCVEYKRISLQSDECCPLILSVISSPLHSLSPIQENWHLLPENVKP